MNSYTVGAEEIYVADLGPGHKLTVAFGATADNARIVRDCEDALGALALKGGCVALLFGPASLPAAVVLAHGLTHKYAVVGVWDPKLSAYVVAASHGAPRNLGDLIAPCDITIAHD